MSQRLPGRAPAVQYSIVLNATMNFSLIAILHHFWMKNVLI